jgi:CRP-like cAMP-binding protein
MLNVGGAKTPFADRIVLIGDSATTKLYKNGIGAAFKTSRAAATTALMHGISSRDFRRYYMPACKRIERDNRIGKLIFSVVGRMQEYPSIMKWILLGVRGESLGYWKKQNISRVLWDVFTGSASYRSILFRMCRLSFFRPMVEMIFRQIWARRKSAGAILKQKGSLPQLGKSYQDGEVIIKQGEEGDTMHVVLTGKVHVFSEYRNREYFLAELGESEFFGEMAIFRKMKRSTTVRAAGPAVILTVDKNTLMQSIQDNPSLAFRMLEKMSERLSRTNEYISRYKEPHSEIGSDGTDRQIPKEFPDSLSS